MKSKRHTATVVMGGVLALSAFLFAGFTLAARSDAASQAGSATATPSAPSPNFVVPSNAPRTADGIPFCDAISGFTGVETYHTYPTQPPAPGTKPFCAAMPTRTNSPLPAPSASTSGSPLLGSGCTDTYYYGGPEVSPSAGLGVWGDIEAVNTSVPHNGTTCEGEFNRFLAKKLVSGSGCTGGPETDLCWIETGIADVSSIASDTRYPYTYSTVDNTTYTFQNYSLTDGNTYAFTLQYQGGNPPLWMPEIWWNGQWVCLPGANDSCTQSVQFAYAGGIEAHGEVATTGTQYSVPNATFGAVNRIQIDNGTSWLDWTSNNFPGTTNVADAPYGATYSTLYDDWYFHD